MSSRSLQRRVAAAIAVLVALGLVVVPALPVPAADGRVATDPALTTRVERVAEAAMAVLPMAGMSVAVARGSDLVYADGFGMADVVGRRPATADTVYAIGSISKQFTAATLLRLEEDGRLDLDDPVTAYVPMPGFDPPPTVRQLLNHTSGLSDWQLGRVLSATSEGVGVSVDEALDHARGPGPAAAPGVVHEYSNGGYLHAYRVVEEAAGAPYRDVLTDEVLVRAGLDDTAACPADPPADWAQPYLRGDDVWGRLARLGRPSGLQPASAVNVDIVNSVCSTAPDLVRWAHGLRTGEVLSPQARREMVTPTELADGTTVPYGLGVQHRRFGEHGAIAHGGILRGFVAMLADFPDDDVTVALLVNTDIDEHQSALLLDELLAAVLDERPRDGWRPDVTGPTPTEATP